MQSILVAILEVLALLREVYIVLHSTQGDLELTLDLVADRDMRLHLFFITRSRGLARYGGRAFYPTIVRVVYGDRP